MSDNVQLLSREAFLDRLKAVGALGYHDKHPFHQMMHRGELDRTQLQAWVANRFYYQAMIPRKDAAVMSKAEDPALRRQWVQRMLDQDGPDAQHGGRSKWLALASAAGLNPADVESFRLVLPGVRFAVDAYLQFVTTRSLFEAVASSLTELFAPPLHAHRISVFQQHYSWIEKKGLEYFETRITQVPNDLEHGLGYVLDHADTVDKQRRAVQAVTIKCQILWGLLDALHYGYVTPGLLPPGFPYEHGVFQ